jgi:hypothetical protein
VVAATAAPAWRELEEALAEELSPHFVRRFAVRLLQLLGLRVQLRDGTHLKLGLLALQLLHRFDI